MIIDKPALDLLFWGEEKFSALTSKNKAVDENTKEAGLKLQIFNSQFVFRVSFLEGRAMNLFSPKKIVK